MKEYLPLPKQVHAPPRGAGLRVLAMVVIAWVGVRVAYSINDNAELAPSTALYEWDAPQPTGRKTPFAQVTEPTMQPVKNRGRIEERGPFYPARKGHGLRVTSSKNQSLPVRLPLMDRRTITAPSASASVSQGLSPAEPPWAQSVPFQMASQPPFWKVAAMEVRPVSVTPPARAVSSSAGKADGPFGLYAYLFYRPDAAPGASATTYGGGQLFARADWRLGQNGLARRSHLYARVSHDMTDGGRAEFAIGGAVQPLAALPVTLHNERRVRTGGPDATAAFVSGGVSDVALPHGVTLNVYGQGGVVWPDRGQSSQFFDGQASLTKPIHTAGSWRLDAGGMAATGGQDSTARLDIGPVVTASTGTGGAQLQGQVGWRFRIAGDASPANGPAVTLSVGF